MIRLQPMTVADYDRILPVMNEGYAQVVARNLAISVEEARARAERQMAGLLKDGLHTPGHLFWLIVDDGQAVGRLWVHVEAEEHAAFIYDIEVDEHRRNQGVGSRALALLEVELRGRGVARVGLTVWADNPGAQALYRKVGYRVTSTHMQKSLAEAETVDQLTG